MSRKLLYALLAIFAYFGFRYWRLQKDLKKEQNQKKNNLENDPKLFQKMKWDAEDIDFEEIKDKEE